MIHLRVIPQCHSCQSLVLQYQEWLPKAYLRIWNSNREELTYSLNFYGTFLWLFDSFLSALKDPRWSLLPWFLEECWLAFFWEALAIPCISHYALWCSASCGWILFSFLLVAFKGPYLFSLRNQIWRRDAVFFIVPTLFFFPFLLIN